MSNMRSITSSVPKVAPETLKKMMVASFRMKKPLMVWGPPGVGKSACVAQVAEYLAKEYEEKGGFGVKDVRLSQYDPVDLRGVPKVESVADVIAAYKAVGDERGLSGHGPEVARLIEEFRKNGNEVRTRWAAPSFLPMEARDGKYGILFLDEITSADPDVQAAAYQLVLDRRLGDYVLPSGWVVMAAGNRPEDRAVVKDMSSALANRLIHVEMDAVVDEWIAWAIKNDVHPTIIAYHRYENGMNLYKFDPTTNDKAYPTPRAWETVSKILKEDLDENIANYFVQGTVGIGFAVEFMAYASIQEMMPNMDDLMKSAQNGDDISKMIPSAEREFKRDIECRKQEKDGTISTVKSTRTFKGYCVLYSVMAAVVSRATPETGKAVWNIIRAIEKDHREKALVLLGDIILKDERLTEGEFFKDYDDFCDRNSDLVTASVPSYA